MIHSDKTQVKFQGEPAQIMAEFTIVARSVITEFGVDAFLHAVEISLRDMDKQDYSVTDMSAVVSTLTDNNDMDSSDEEGSTT